MNAYFDHFSVSVSNKGIIEAYFEESVYRRTLLQKWFAKGRTLFCERVMPLVKPVSLVLAITSLAGVIGAIEHGRLPLLGGFLLGAAVIFAEFLILRARRK